MTSPIEIRAGYTIGFHCPQPTPLLLMVNLRPERRPDLLTPQVVSVTPPVPMHDYLDGFGNVCTRLLAPAGEITITTDFAIRDSGLPDEAAPDAPQLPVQDLPDDILVFLLGSRYCETDELSDTAWELFGGTPTAGRGSRRSVDSCTTGSASDIRMRDRRAAPCRAIEERIGVCRDFAHLAVALCRCMNIPARYCTGYLGDIGVPQVAAPMDFSAWFEAYLGGRWYTFDARHNTPRIGRILMAPGATRPTWRSPRRSDAPIYAVSKS